MVVVSIWVWSGWTAYRSCLRVRQPNPDLINTFRVIFQPEKVNQAAEILDEKARAINELPVEEPTPTPEAESDREGAES